MISNQRDELVEINHRNLNSKKNDLSFKFLTHRVSLPISLNSFEHHNHMRLPDQMSDEWKIGGADAGDCPHAIMLVTVVEESYEATSTYLGNLS